MVTFIVSFLLLILGYVLYGAFVDKVFGSDPQRQTPCYTLLNIAGTGPIFGAIQGILFGPAAYLWIVLGCVLGGAVHDYMSGMISLRKNGASLPEIVGDELGSVARIALRVMALVLMILVGAVFVTTPAGLLANMIGGDSMLGENLFWIVIIFAYYLLATLLPIDKLIGRIYPIFGIALLLMGVGLIYGILAYDGNIPEITEAFSNHHPTSTMPIFPGLCITIACGAVSGFHATQSPMMARCLKNEKHGRPIFYGAMITEGLVALIWAAAAIKFADSFDVTKYGMTGDEAPYAKLWALMTNGGTSNANPAVLVNVLCTTWLGKVGAVLAILGVVAAPITSGDTALRSARLIAADFMHYKQNRIYKRLILSLPIFVISGVLMFVKFDVLWRYFAWFNQSLAVVTLWTITVWLTKRSAAEGTKKYAFLVTLVPALWMTIVCSTYIFIAPEGFQLHHFIAYLLGGLVTVGVLVWYILWAKKQFAR